MTSPLCIELYAGLHGWGEGFISEGFRVIGFDIVDMGATLGIPRPAGVSLVLQDVLTLHGSQFKDAAVIVASPPCQAYSYRAMPWKRAKALPPPDNALFDACFRIQREAISATTANCPACGGKGFVIWYVGDTRECERCYGKGFIQRYIPLIVENVKGAQPWVGRARWHYGSFYLWGDVPALMPTIFKAVKWGDCNGKRFDERPRGNVAAHREGTKQQAAGKGIEYGGDFGWDGSAMRSGNSKSPARKAASAMIAKIPFELARHIARVFKPAETERVA